jgi:hypothetical protein
MRSYKDADWDDGFEMFQFSDGEERPVYIKHADVTGDGLIDIQDLIEILANF